MTAPIDDQETKDVLRVVGYEGDGWRREWVMAKAIQADPTYQRGVSMAHVRQIAKAFNPFSAAGIKVSRRSDGSLWVIDGNHRIKAYMIARGEQVVIPVDVIEGLTVKQEAFLFSEQNKRRQLKTQQTHIALVAAGDRLHTCMDEILGRHGLDAHANPSYRKDAEKRFTGLRTLQDIVLRAGPTHADEAVEIAVTALRRPGKQMAAHHLAGISQLLIKFGDLVDRERLVRVLRDVDLSQINGQGEAIKSVVGRSPENAFGMVFHQIYNRRLGTGRLPEWESVGLAEMARRAEELRKRDGETWS